MTAPESRPSTELCSIKLIQQYNRQKLGAAAVDGGAEMLCPSTCTGLRSEPRTIGKITLPSLFDRVFCDNPGSTEAPRPSSERWHRY